MNQIVENLTGMDVLTDQVIATDLLFAAKSGIKSYAAALSETASSEVRTMLMKHFEQAVHAHQQISDHMIRRGWYHPHNVDEQIRLDLKNSEAALNLP